MLQITDREEPAATEGDPIEHAVFHCAVIGDGLCQLAAYSRDVRTSLYIVL